MQRIGHLLSLLLFGLLLLGPIGAQKPLNVGIIGLDTSHVVAFTKIINDPKEGGDLAGMRVVAGYPGGSDISYSLNRIEGYTKELRSLGVEIVDSIPALLERVDCVLLESVDGRPHLAEASLVFEARKPLFIDKPLAGSLADALAIAELGRKHEVPWFSCSSLRHGASVPTSVGKVLGCVAWSPCPVEPSQPDLFWYGIHGVETLFTIMGPGCERVVRSRSDGAEVVTGTWKDGRIGTFRGIRHGKRGYGAIVFGAKRIAQREKYSGYRPLVLEVAKFFRTRKVPVSNAETLEIYAFMEAADESRRQGGRPVSLESVLAKASRARQQKPPRPNILFCIADDWSWPHAGAYGDSVVQTPTFDAIAQRGVLFSRAFCAAPSCTPSRAAILTGQAIHRLAEGANLHGFLPARFQVYTELLEQAGYTVGYQGKGWGPGKTKPAGRERNPAGRRHKDFGAFLETVPGGKPFCYWYGSHDPHRPYKRGCGKAQGMSMEAVTVPPFLPDTDEVRSDILDYYVEVQRFDTKVGELLAELKAKGLHENTLVVVTSDNGMPFPRAKATLYDAGTRMPLTFQWPARLRGGHTSLAFVSFTDFAPTFLEAAGVTIPAEMTGQSLLPLLFTGKVEGRRRVFLERERHAHVRKGNASYPSRAIRTRRYLYIRNLRPERWPAGDPSKVFSVGPYGDVDGSPSKKLILADQESRFFKLAFARRPAEEFYDLEKDPWQLENLAGSSPYEKARAQLRKALQEWMQATADPRASDDDDRFDGYPYYGRRSRRR